MNIREIFAALDGASIPGGCEACDALQEPWIDEHGICHITVRHDDVCPVYRRVREAGR